MEDQKKGKASIADTAHQTPQQKKEETQEKTQVFNPDMNKEVLLGILGMLLFMGGIIVSFVGLITMTETKTLGIVIWIAGSFLIGGSLALSIKNKHGKGFRIANIAIKSIVLAISLIGFILLLTFVLAIGG